MLVLVLDASLLQPAATAKQALILYLLPLSAPVYSALYSARLYATPHHHTSEEKFLQNKQHHLAAFYWQTNGIGQKKK